MAKEQGQPAESSQADAAVSDSAMLSSPSAGDAGNPTACGPPRPSEYPPCDESDNEPPESSQRVSDESDSQPVKRRRSESPEQATLAPSPSSLGENEISLHDVRTSTYHQIEVDPSWDMARLRLAIKDKTGMESYLQHFIFRGKEVRESDPSSLADIGLLASKEHLNLIRRQRTPGVCGLRNLGNTCYFNSVVQCLSNMSRFSEFFLSDTWQNQVNRDNSFGSGGQVVTAFAELLRKMWHGVGADSFHCTQALKSALERKQTRFQGYSQHDAQELATALLDQLHEDCNAMASGSCTLGEDPPRLPDTELANRRWWRHISRNRSAVVDAFYGQLQVEKICNVCEHRSASFDPFMDLSIPIRDETITMLELYWVPGGSEPRMELRVRTREHNSARSVLQNTARLLGRSEEGLVLMQGSGDYLEVIPPNRCVTEFKKEKLSVRPLDSMGRSRYVPLPPPNDSVPFELEKTIEVTLKHITAALTPLKFSMRWSELLADVKDRVATLAFPDAGLTGQNIRLVCGQREMHDPCHVRSYHAQLEKREIFVMKKVPEGKSKPATPPPASEIAVLVNRPYRTVILAHALKRHLAADFKCLPELVSWITPPLRVLPGAGATVSNLLWDLVGGLGASDSRGNGLWGQSDKDLSLVDLDSQSTLGKLEPLEDKAPIGSKKGPFVVLPKTDLTVQVHFHAPGLYGQMEAVGDPPLLSLHADTTDEELYAAVASHLPQPDKSLSCTPPPRSVLCEGRQFQAGTVEELRKQLMELTGKEVNLSADSDGKVVDFAPNSARLVDLVPEGAEVRVVAKEAVEVQVDVRKDLWRDSEKFTMESTDTVADLESVIKELWNWPGKVELALEDIVLLASQDSSEYTLWQAGLRDSITLKAEFKNPFQLFARRPNLTTPLELIHPRRKGTAAERKVGVLRQLFDKRVQEIKLQTFKAQTLGRSVMLQCNLLREMGDELEKRRATQTERHPSCQEAEEWEREQNPAELDLDELLRRNCQTEQMDSDNGWRCPHCRVTREAFTRVRVWRPPQNLIIQLKRFSHSGHVANKINTPVRYPRTGLNLGPHCAGPLEGREILYDLSAVCCHSGSASFGHYIAYGRNCKTDKWYRFDDSWASESSESSAYQDQAYLLFYRLRSPDSVPAPPSAPAGCIRVAEKNTVTPADASAAADEQRPEDNTEPTSTIPDLTRRMLDMAPVDRSGVDEEVNMSN